MTDQLNFFERLAGEQMVAPHKAKLRAADKRAAKKASQYTSDKDAPLVLTPSEKATREREKQARNYYRWKRAELRMHLEGEHKIQWVELIHLLRKMTLESADQLVRHVRKAQWLVGADQDTRHMALHVIANAIVRLRIQNGYEPFEDSMPFTDEPPTAFEIIRDILVKRAETFESSQRGSP